MNKRKTNSIKAFSKKENLSILHLHTLKGGEKVLGVKEDTELE